MNAARLAVMAVGGLLILASTIVLVRATHAGEWVALVVVAVGAALAAFPLLSSVARRARASGDRGER